MKDKPKADTVTRMFEEMGVKVVDVTPKKKFVSISNPKDTKSGVSIQPKVDNKWVEDFDKIFPCITAGCDNDGVIPEQDGEGDWQPAQCEFCYKVRFPVKDFIQELITQTQQETLEWCLKEAVGEDETKDIWNDEGKILVWINSTKQEIRQTIKQRMEGK